MDMILNLFAFVSFIGLVVSVVYLVGVLLSSLKPEPIRVRDPLYRLLELRQEDALLSHQIASLCVFPNQTDAIERLIQRSTEVVQEITRIEREVWPNEDEVTRLKRWHQEEDDAYFKLLREEDKKNERT